MRERVGGPNAYLQGIAPKLRLRPEGSVQDLIAKSSLRQYVRQLLLRIFAKCGPREGPIGLADAIQSVAARNFSAMLRGNLLSACDSCGCNSKNVLDTVPTESGLFMVRPQACQTDFNHALPVPIA